MLKVRMGLVSRLYCFLWILDAFWTLFYAGGQRTGICIEYWQEFIHPFSYTQKNPPNQWLSFISLDFFLWTILELAQVLFLLIQSISSTITYLNVENNLLLLIINSYGPKGA